MCGYGRRLGRSRRSRQLDWNLSCTSVDVGSEDEADEAAESKEGAGEAAEGK
jgi:hypothetical protein